jgi:hypothetical protein
MPIEYRTFSTNDVKVEERGEGKKPKISGHAAVFDSLSENLGGFREKIDIGAFDDVLKDDARALFNHDRNFVLGRVGAGTLRLSVDDTGLKYEIDPPDTQAARDLMTSMERGDINQSSFGFIIDSDKWEEDEDGRTIRTITKVRELKDVSPVTYPAYTDTAVAVRSMNDWIESKKPDDSYKIDLDLKRKRLALL